MDIKLRYPFNGEPRLMQGFGANASVYKRFGQNGHPGLDFGIYFQPVLAAHDGVVEFAGDGGEWPIMGKAAGNCIVLNTTGYRTGYAHLSRIYVTHGQHVKAGEVIAISGDTGAVTGPHLHFDLMPKPHKATNGFVGRIDPTPYLIGAGQ